MSDSKNQPAELLLARASQLVEDAAFDLASKSPVDVIARLIVISAELQEIACKTEKGSLLDEPKRKYSDA